MNSKTITGFVLWFCIIAVLSITQIDSARLNSRHRFKREGDESIACPEGTKPCKDDNTMCVTYCNGNPECADGSDELDCATAAPDASATTASAEITESNGNEVERANVLADSTDATEATLPQITILDRETVPAAAVETTTSLDGAATQESATENAEGPATGDVAGTTAAPESEASNAPAGDDTVTGASGDATTAAADATTAAADATTAEAAATEAATESATSGDASTGAAATEGHDATAGAEATEAADSATTAAAATEAADSATTAEAGTAATEAAEGGATTSASDHETATGIPGEQSTDAMTSAKPDSGHGAEDDNGTSSAAEATTGAGDVSDHPATVDGTTVESHTATTAAEATETGSDVTSGAPVEGSTEAAPAVTTAIGGSGAEENGTQPTVSEDDTTAAAPVQPEPSGRVELRVVVSPEILHVQRGQTFEMTCTVYGADASTTIYWIQEEPERRYALIDPAQPDDKQVTMSQVSLRARVTIDDPSKIGKYTCMAQDTAGNSGAAILTMEEGRYSGYPRPVYPPVVPGQSSGRGYLRIVAPDMAEGDYVEIQCEGAASEDEGRIQWFFNNKLLSDEQPLYPRGKTLHIRPISRGYLGNYRCSIPGSSYADANSVLTFGGPAPSAGGAAYPGAFSVRIDIEKGQTIQGIALENSQVTFRCFANEQPASFRWIFASNQGTTTRGSTDQLVIPRATIQDSGLYTCEGTNSRGQTARAIVNLYVTATPSQPITGRCSIDEATCRNGRCIPRSFLYDGKNDCGDNSDEAAGSSSGDSCQPNEIRCTNTDRGRKCVQKFWMCDGDRDCDDGSDEDQRYCELLPRQRYCKPSEFHCGGPNATTPNPVCIPRSFQCDGYNDCPDRSDEVGCVKPIVVAAPQRHIQVNAGQTFTIQCTARGAPAPYLNWRLNWGHVCGDGSDNGRCTMAQAVDSNDPSLVTGTLTVRNVNMADGGAYSCEAINNQGFVFAVPDAIVDVIVDQSQRPAPSQQCNCNGHSSQCSPNGQCLNCQHNTVGYNCEFCATGYQGDAHRGTPQDCQPTSAATTGSRCNPSGTHMERSGRCICKYNVEGDRCDQCKRSHFYLNPSTPNGCLPCFCSGVSTECTSSDWRRQSTALPLTNWNAVPKNFATDAYEARDRIQQRNGGREIALDQSSLGRAANEVLYWKAPKEALGNLVTLYDGNIDVHFTNDGNDNEAPSNDEFIWLRGNNVDLVHKLPSTQRFKANTDATYSVPVNERTFTRKDGTYIDRENILMALSDLDTLLVKINPIGGKRNAVLRGVKLNVASHDGFADVASTVELCRCPANYTGPSCEKCAEGYGRPHPLVGIYLGQCWSCRSLCNDRSDRCDRDTGKCLDCQANSEGDRCERCRSGYILDPRLNQCVRDDQYGAHPVQPYGAGSRGSYYVNHQPYDGRSTTPMTIDLDGNLPEQRVPLQVLNAQPQSVAWGRVDGSLLPPNVAQEGNDLVFRHPSAEQAGNYIVTITHPDGATEHIPVYVQYRPGQGAGYPTFSPASPLTLREGENQYVQPQGGYYRVQWRRDGNQPLPAGVYQNGNALQIISARPDHSGLYYCDLYAHDGTHVAAPYDVRVQAADRVHAGAGGPPRISIEPKTINLKEGQRMIVQYSVSSHEPISVVWRKVTDQGYQSMPSSFTVDPNRLLLNRATPEVAGTYEVVVSNPSGEDRQELRINVEPRRGRGREQQAGAPRIRFQQDQYEVGPGEVVDVVPAISGANGAKATWSKDDSAVLPDGVYAHNDGALRVEGRSSNVGGRYTLEVNNAYGRVSSPIVIRWKESAASQHASNGHNQDGGRSYSYIRFEPGDASNHQVGRTIQLQCVVHGSIERPYEYSFTKDGQPLGDNVEVHPNGILIIRNAQASDSGRYRCEVNFPSFPQAGTQETSYDLRVHSSYHAGHINGYQHGGDAYAPSEFVEVTIEPSEATLGRGEKANLTCRVKGTQNYNLVWTKYAHDPSLPSYAEQRGNSVILAPTDESLPEQMYLQCSVYAAGQSQPYVAYAPFTLRAHDELLKKKKKRRS